MHGLKKNKPKLGAQCLILAGATNIDLLGLNLDLFDSCGVCCRVWVLVLLVVGNSSHGCFEDSKRLEL